MGSSGGIRLYKLSMVTNEVMNAVAEYLTQYVFTEGPNRDSKKVFVQTDKHDRWGEPYLRRCFADFRRVLQHQAR